MFVGHTGLALLLAGRRATPPLWLLVVAAYGSDWLELPARLAGWSPERTMALTHSLAATLVAGALAGALHLLAARDRSSAALVAVAWWSHWAADFVTASKPAWPGGPHVGLGLYDHGAADLLIESAVVVAGWIAFARRRRPPRAARLLAPAALVALQLAFVNQHRLAAGDWKQRVLQSIVARVRGRVPRVDGTETS
ncbi:MAG TPA: hypothetical protein VEA99_02220 [Gemmatimonadaceae bacterium]|nr:hypothetical protein [Gemmatimonadaceae bacterium]